MTFFHKVEKKNSINLGKNKNNSLNGFKLNNFIIEDRKEKSIKNEMNNNSFSKTKNKILPNVKRILTNSLKKNGNKSFFNQRTKQNSFSGDKVHNNNYSFVELNNIYLGTHILPSCPLRNNQVIPFQSSVYEFRKSNNNLFNLIKQQKLCYINNYSKKAKWDNKKSIIRINNSNRNIRNYFVNNNIDEAHNTNNQNNKKIRRIEKANEIYNKENKMKDTEEKSENFEKNTKKINIKYYPQRKKNNSIKEIIYYDNEGIYQKKKIYDRKQLEVNIFYDKQENNNSNILNSKDKHCEKNIYNYIDLESNNIKEKNKEKENKSSNELEVKIGEKPKIIEKNIYEDKGGMNNIRLLRIEKIKNLYFKDNFKGGNDYKEKFGKKGNGDINKKNLNNLNENYEHDIILSKENNIKQESHSFIQKFQNKKAKKENVMTNTNKNLKNYKEQNFFNNNIYLLIN